MINQKLETVFSAAQPTGVLHIGNYFGAILQWKNLQDGLFNTIFSVVDLHAITVKYDHITFQDVLISTAAQYLACGIKENLSILFVQSHVKEHAELAWLLNTLTPISWMDKMTQFKNKARNNAASLGLYSYPVLMAADILLYKATKVPAGNDQMQHLELTIDIAKKFNRCYGVEYFVIPDTLNTTKLPVRIMNLKDPTKKMSKSDENINSRIDILDSSDLIVKKIKCATTDSILGFDPYTLNNRPAALNLINIYSLLTNKSCENICCEFDNFNHLKSELTNALIAILDPIRKNFEFLIKDKLYLSNILKNGANKAREIATNNIKEIKTIMGLERN